jgi:putative DNA primase/helicase
VIADLRSLARLLGGDVIGRQVLAPGPGHSPKDRSLSVTISATAPDGFLAFSHSGDDFASCRDHVKRALGLPSDRPTPQMRTPRAPQPRPDDAEREARRAKYIAQTVAELQPIIGTPGERYLRETRRIDTGAITDVLERTDAIAWHPSVLFREEGHTLHDKRIGCIVAVLTNPVTAAPTGGISRTYIHEGQKVAKAKGLGPAGVVRLSLDEDVLGGLHLAEGLETALAAMSIGLRPTWSVGSTAIMAKLPVVSGIEAISVIADNDANGAGERAARELQARWKSAGRVARVWKPKTLGDLNDILMGGAK